MYNHSVKVQELALEIASEVPCNKTIVAICALLHDIGKTYKANPEILHKDHQKFNLTVSKSFLGTLELDTDSLKKIYDIIRYESKSTEMKIVKDADALALYADKKLYTSWIARAYKVWVEYEIARKLGKYDHLFFDISKRIGKPRLEKMKKDREEYEYKMTTI